jgi:hypothetical protein
VHFIFQHRANQRVNVACASHFGAVVIGFAYQLAKNNYFLSG